MKILLDTHCFLWMQSAPDRLSDDALRLLRDPETTLYLSAASSWEMAIKVSLGKLKLPIPVSEYVPSRMERSVVTPMPIQHPHALHVASLPMHHRDPFDRMIIAQAQYESLPILTTDPQFEPYDVELLMT